MNNRTANRDNLVAQLANGNAPGMEGLKARVETALQLNVESPGLEFRCGETWDALSGRLTKTVLAMSNLQDGGLIVIGRPENTTLPEGVSADQLASFDPDVMRDLFDSYASPRAICNIAQVSVASHNYVAIEVIEFDENPVICKKDLGNSPKFVLRAGGLYIRPFTGRPRSILVSSAEEMRAVIDLAIDKRFLRFEEQAGRRGYVRVPADPGLFEAELGDLA